ncbi:MAG TPA: hypothetical protein VK154_06415, partial [Chitinophagales bacterium]|nr:hypothetical protein [Chitinophagales bacterium]
YTYILGQSVLLSRFIGALHAVVKPVLAGPSAPKIGRANIDQKDPTQYHINDIKAMCDSAGIPVTQFLLPSRFALAEKQPPAYAHINAISPALLPLQHYPQGNDDHPDNAGHYKLAAAMQHVIDSVQHNRVAR